MPRAKKPQRGGSAAEGARVEVRGANGSHVLVVTFTSGTQTIHADPGSMVYTRGLVSPSKPIVEGGLAAGVARMFAGQSVFVSEYSGAPDCTPQAPGILALSADMPSDIVRIEIPEGTSFRISRGSFLACTANVKVHATVQAKGILGIGQEEGFVLPTLEAPPGSGHGVAWLSSYGLTETHELAGPADVMTVDNGVFLAVDGAQTPYEIVKLGRTLLGSLFSGEGFGMRFRGPCKLYTQSKNFTDFSFMVAHAAGLDRQSGGSATTKKKVGRPRS